MEPTNNEYVSCTITEIEDNKINVRGFIKSPGNYHKMIIMAPNPIDTITSFSGKGLPFPCEMIAFENTPNFETIQLNGKFNVDFLYPNSYYTPDGYTKIKSPIVFSLDNKKIIIELNDKCPLKTLRDRKRGDLTQITPETIGRDLNIAEQATHFIVSRWRKHNIKIAGADALQSGTRNR